MVLLLQASCTPLGLWRVSVSVLLIACRLYLLEVYVKVGGLLSQQVSYG